MKKNSIITFIAAILISSISMAQTTENDTISSSQTNSSNRDITAWQFDGMSVYLPQSSAYVGIRNEYPDEALHVDGGVKIGLGTSATERSANVLYFGDEDYVKIGEFDADDMLSFKASKFNFKNGNVGIHTTSAAYPLDVNGKMYLRTIDVDPVTNWNRSYLYWASHNLIMGTPPGEPSHNSLDLKPGGTTTIPDPLFSRLRMYTATSTNVQTQKVELCTESNCWFLNEGNFGIGTSSPTHKLDVRGTIRANEILVNIPSGADFVFEENYQLMPLESLSEYVRQNKHLPEVQSAADMEQDGVTMGEFQIQLLQKVEELTLYIIQQQKEINNLKEQIEKLNIKED